MDEVQPEPQPLDTGIVSHTVSRETSLDANLARGRRVDPILTVSRKFVHRQGQATLPVHHVRPALRPRLLGAASRAEDEGLQLVAAAP